MESKKVKISDFSFEIEATCEKAKCLCEDLAIALEINELDPLATAELVLSAKSLGLKACIVIDQLNQIMQTCGKITALCKEFVG